jgi:ATP/maltotriose-dependent transcriptional regulator MalT
MARAEFDYEELVADLAERRRQLAAVARERDGLANEVRLAREALEAEQDAQYEAYRQLVELERVRAFDDVARGIEHDLYNALTPVEGYTELLLMHPERLADASQARAYLNAIMAASEDAKHTVQRLREFYYSTGSLDIDEHGSVSQTLAKALANHGDDAGAAPPLTVVGDMEEEEVNGFDGESLSPREWDVLKLLADGSKNREIGETLSISENTVKTHIKAILLKLSLKNRTQAAAYALLDKQAFENGSVDANTAD